MSKQIFKINIDNNIFFDFLDKNCSIENNIYTFDISSYKRSKLNNSYNDFINELKDKYYESKKSYIDRAINYNRFTTIIRQICNANSINFTSKIIYFGGSYHINYYIIKQNNLSCS